jgi:hypothetical protein
MQYGGKSFRRSTVLAQFRTARGLVKPARPALRDWRPDQLADLKNRENFQTQQNHSGNDCEIEEGFHQDLVIRRAPAYSVQQAPKTRVPGYTDDNPLFADRWTRKFSRYPGCYPGRKTREN